ncbi:SDR family oxidoreductase [bacterium]|nr:SDR family oxidoreductase [bacterium]
MNLASKHILVAGGTRGLGAAISRELARAGASVLANYVRNEEAAQKFLSDCRAASLPVEGARADLTSKGGLDSLTESLRTWLDGTSLDGLVFCAATGVHKPVDQLTDRHFDWTFALNVRALLALVNRLLPLFSDHVSVVPVSSLGARLVSPAYSLVGASKGALESLSRHLALELGSRGVRVNILCPGTIETDAWKVLPDAEERLATARQRSFLGRLVTLDEVAHVAAFLCSDASSGMSGATVVVDGGESLPM